MLDYSNATDRVFHALADGTRRRLIEHLSAGPAAASDLMQPLSISLAAVLQHLQVLEASGLVVTHKTGRVRTCELDRKGLLAAEQWIAGRRLLWESRLRALDGLLAAGVASTSRTRARPTSGTSPARKPSKKPTVKPGAKP